MSQILLRKPEVKSITGIKADSSLYFLIQSGEFPRPVKVGGRSSAWVKAEIDEWVEKKIAERDASAA